MNHEAKEELRPNLNRHHTHFQDDPTVPQSKPHDDASLSSSDDDQPISQKMKELSSAQRTQKRQITTVLMQAPPKASAFSQYTIDEEVSNQEGGKEELGSPEMRGRVQELPSTPKQLHKTKRPSLPGKDSPGPVSTDFINAQFLKTQELSAEVQRLQQECAGLRIESGKLKAELAKKNREVDPPLPHIDDTLAQRERVLHAEELNRTKMDMQRMKQEADRALLNEKAKVETLSDTLSYFLFSHLEKIAANKDLDLQKAKQEADSCRKEVSVLRQKDESLYKEIQTLQDRLRQVEDQMAVRETFFQTEMKAKESATAAESKGSDSLKIQLVRNKQDQTTERLLKAEQDVLHWKRRANMAEGDENSASIRLEGYLHELSDLKLQVSIFDAKHKVADKQETAAAYRALQKEYASLLDEKTQSRSRSVSPIPAKPEQVTTAAFLPEDKKPKLPVISVIRNNAQMLGALEQKFAKLQTERNTLQRELDGIIETESVQSRGKKHTLTMELSMIDSSIALLTEKIARYRKSVA